MLQKPTTKTLASTAVSAGAFVVGAKIGDGIVAVLPDSMNSYKKFAIAGASLILAACVVPKTTIAQAGQSALIGLGAKQLYDEFTSAIATAVPVKLDSTGNAVVPTTASEKFMNALTGRGLNSPIENHSRWLGEPGDIWDRPEYEEQKKIEFTGV